MWIISVVCVCHELGDRSGRQHARRPRHWMWWSGHWSNTVMAASVVGGDAWVVVLICARLEARMSPTGHLLTRSNEVAFTLPMCFVCWMAATVVYLRVRYPTTSVRYDIVRWSHPRSISRYRLINMITTCVLCFTCAFASYPCGRKVKLNMPHQLSPQRTYKYNSTVLNKHTI